MSDLLEPIRWPGHMVGLGLFVFAGLPASLLFLIAERMCDMGLEPPCAVSWKMGKLLFLLATIALCAFAGWLTNKLVNRIRAVRARPFG